MDWFSMLSDIGLLGLGFAIGVVGTAIAFLLLLSDIGLLGLGFAIGVVGTAIAFLLFAAAEISKENGKKQ